MTRYTLLFLVLFAGFSSSLYAQDQGSNLSLQQAIDYALKNNPNLQNAKVDVEIARKKVLETTAIGLPHINGEVSYTGAPQIATQVVPNFIDPSGPPLEFQMGISHTGMAKINANWLLADGTYFLGLKAAKQYVELASRSMASTEVETRINVSKAYYMALIGDQSILTLDSNIRTLQKTLDDTRAMYENGFAEKIDVSRLQLQMSNLKIQLEKTKNQRDYAYRILKFQMGMDVETPIMLTDKLLTLQVNAGTMDTSAKVSPENRPEYQMLMQQQVLNEMNVTRYQMGYLPSLSAFGAHQQNTFAVKDQFSELGKTFYGGTTWGLSLKVPIFSGMQRSAQVQQARLETIKTRNDLNNLENVIKNEAFNARANYLTASMTMHSQQQNYELAKEIRDIAQAKYDAGVGTSLEVTLSNQDLLQAETNYLNAIYEFLVAEIEYKKALGLIN